ncbi:MAG: hypothetical protein ACT4QF_22660 [Sporichthyaceae bacterium]
MQALLLAGAVPAAAAPAPQAPTIGEVRVPKVVVLPASTKASAATAFAIVLKVADSDGVDTVVVGLYPPGRKKGTAVRATRTGGSAASGTWTAKVRIGATQPVGTWKVAAFATDRDQRTSDPTRVVAGYDVRTPTRFSGFGIGEPVQPGARIEVEGALQRWAGSKGWVPYGGRELALEFRPEGRKAFEPVETLTTGGDGTVGETKAAAESAGAWRLSFAGFDTAAATVSREDEVKPVAPKPAPKADEAPAETSEGEKSEQAGAAATPSPTPTASPGPQTARSPRAEPTGKPDVGESARSRPRQPAPTSSPSSTGSRTGPVNR